MGQVNTVVIVSDKQELVNQISQKLVLLRNLDKIKSCSIEEAQNMLEGFSPNVLILHCDNNNVHAINLVKQMNLSDFESEEVEVQETVKPQIVNVESVKVEDEHQDQGKEQEIVQETTRKRGRPAGSKNKKTLLKEARERRKLEKLGLTEMPVVPKKRGRPLGSKNKKRKSK